MERKPGTLVTPEVKLVRPLSEGAMGSLWVGHHSRLDHAVAVKFIADKLVGDAGALARFQREARAAAQLQSEHVVRTHDYGMTDDRVPYIVMELLEGETLGERLRRGARLSIEDTVRLVGHVCEALTEAHGHGTIHRDIKPDNIFLVRTKGPLQAKVLDFGMAKQATTRGGSIVTATGVIVGTPEYMSPEQVLGSKQVDHRADLWALGVVTYRVLFGDLPFVHETPHGLIFAICEGQYLAPSAREAPASLDGWFERTLAPQVDTRFPSAKEMAAGFSHAVASAGEAIRTIGQTVVHTGEDASSPTQLSDAPTLASALSTREPNVSAAPRPAAGRAAQGVQAGRARDPSTLVSSGLPGAAGATSGEPDLDGKTLERSSPLSSSFGPSSSADGGTLQCEAPGPAPVRLGTTANRGKAAGGIQVKVAEAPASDAQVPDRAPPPPQGSDPGAPIAPNPGAPMTAPQSGAGPAAVVHPPGAPQVSLPQQLPQPWANEPMRSVLPTLLPAQELREERARGRRAGWWAVLIIGTAVAAIGVAVVLWLSPDLSASRDEAPATSASSVSTPKDRSERRGQTEVAHPRSATSQER